MEFELTILGAGAALPARGRYPSAQLLKMGGSHFLIDCGEGTQERLRAGKHNFQRISHVFISHMHGDHYLGLLGLLSTMHLLGRTKDLHVHGPEPLKEIVHLQFKASHTHLRFPLHFHVNPSKSGILIYEDEQRQVFSLELKHRIPCTGFLFKEQNRLRKLNREKVHIIPHYKRKEIQAGADLESEDGTIIPNEELTLGPVHHRSYAYCSDTGYSENLIPFIDGVDLLYHEATFTEHLRKRAAETHHSTAKQAATIAKLANVGRLLLGHFSSRYKTAEPLLQEALGTFVHTEAAEEGRTYSLDQQGIVQK